MSKSYRCKVIMPEFKGLVLRTDAVPTHACSPETVLFVWEKNTKYNQYNGWSGYISEKNVKLLERGEK